MADVKKTVLVDTTFLITLANPKYPNYAIANKYYKYMLANGIQLFLSAIVVAEYHQLASAAEWLASGNFIFLPFNVPDATHLSNVVHNLGSSARNDARKTPTVMILGHPPRVLNLRMILSLLLRPRRTRSITLSRKTHPHWQSN